MPRLQSTLVPLALTLLLVPFGCEDEDHGAPCDDARLGGVIEGRVITGGIPATARITALDRARGDSEFEVGTDSTGAFHLDLPVGSYWLSARVDRSWAEKLHYNLAGPPYDLARRDSLEVSADSPITADFLLASLRIEIEFPAAVESRGVYVSGYRVTAGGDPQERPRDGSFYQATEVENGRAIVAIGGLAPGAYLAYMRTDTWAEDWLLTQELWLPAARSCAEAETIQVAVGTTTQYYAAIPGDPARITGSIVGSWRELATRRPMITLVVPDSAAVVAVLPVGDDGTFATNVLVPEPVRALIDIGGTQRWYPHGSFQESAVLDLVAGATLPPIVVEESGLLLEVSHPLHPYTEDARVQLLSREQAQVVATLPIPGAPAGPFHAFSNLDPGDYWLRIAPSQFLWVDWRPQWFDRAAGQDGAALVHVPAGGGVGRVSIVLEDGGRIEGEVSFEITPATPAATAYLTEAADPLSLGHRPASGTGHYVASGLPDGDYKIGVWLGPARMATPQPPEDTVWYPATTDWNAAQVLTITDAAVISGIDFDLP